MTTSAKSIKEELEKLLNLSIGLIRTGEQSFKTSVKSILASLENIKEKGAVDNSQEAKNIKEALEKSIVGIEHFSDQVQINFQKITTEFQSIYSQVSDRLEGFLGKDEHDKIKKKIVDFYESTQSKTQEIHKNALNLLDRIKGNASK